MSFDIPGLPLGLSISLKRHLKDVENRLMSLAVGMDDLLDIRTAYLARAGGKRLRPALVALTSMLESGADPHAVEAAGTLVELTHLASLYHDDVMDQAPLRRGIPAAHQVFGNSQAILAGDLLFARASAVAVELGIDVVDLHARTFARLCAGQMNETIGPREGEDPVAHHFKVLADKTGSLIAVSARYGAMLCNQPETVQNSLAEYGEKMGVAFQIADDVIDLSPDSRKTGKVAGTDLREGVVTMPVLLLRERRQNNQLDEAGEEILQLLDTADLSDDGILAGVVARLRVHEVVAKTQEMARDLVADAVAQLEVVSAGVVKDALVTFARMMVDRVS